MSHRTAGGVFLAQQAGRRPGHARSAPLRVVCTAGVAGPVLARVPRGAARSAGGTCRGHPTAVTRDPQRHLAGTVGWGSWPGWGVVLPLHGAASRPPSLRGAAAEGEAATCWEHGGTGADPWGEQRGLGILPGPSCAAEPAAEPLAWGGQGAPHLPGRLLRVPGGVPPSEHWLCSLPSARGHAPHPAGATTATTALGWGMRWERRRAGIRAGASRAGVGPVCLRGCGCLVAGHGECCGTGCRAGAGGPSGSARVAGARQL